MEQASTVYWHYALSVIHRKVAIASFLRSTQDLQLPVYYVAYDPATLLIAEVAALVGAMAFTWDNSLYREPWESWVLVRSHREGEAMGPADLGRPHAINRVLRTADHRNRSADVASTAPMVCHGPCHPLSIALICCVPMTAIT